MKERCILWGIGRDYEKIINQIHFEMYKGNIVIEAIVCRKEDRYCDFRDGVPIIEKEKINAVEFDYLIITSSHFYKEIKAEAIELGVEVRKIINGGVFQIPLFDFALYSELIKNPLTILSDDCWGGNVYHYLGLEFSSPLINIYWDRNEYAEFIQNPIFYLNTELQMVREGNLEAGVFPIAKLGEGSKCVQMQLIHNTCFEEAKQQWDRRKKRMNFNNLFIKMGFARCEENYQLYLKAFERCKFRKILFYNGAEVVENTFKTNRFIWRETTAESVEYFNYNDYMRLNCHMSLDILKLLTGNDNYTRE